MSQAVPLFAHARAATRRYLPRQCQICAGWDRAPVCERCRLRFAQPRGRCPLCALPAPDGAICGECLRATPPWSGCVAAVDYGFPWDRMIAQLKFGARPDLAAPLADLLGAAIVGTPVAPAFPLT